MNLTKISIGIIIIIAVITSMFILDGRWTKTTVTAILDNKVRLEDKSIRLVIAEEGKNVRIKLAASRRRMDQHELQSTWEFLDKRMWTIKERHRGRSMSQTVREEYYDLEVRKKKIEKKLR